MNVGKNERDIECVIPCEIDRGDPVHHPSHYTYGNIECIDFILDKNLDFCLGNAIKYIVRSGRKLSASKSVMGKQIEDLEKAKQYIEFEIEHLKGLR